MKPPSLTIAEVNSLGRAEFVGRFGAIYEKSPWVAEGAWNARPFADATALENALADVVRHASHAQQLELLQKHPRLGTRLALSGYSRSEQAGAGLLDVSAAERAELEQLNNAMKRSSASLSFLPCAMPIRAAFLTAAGRASTMTRSRSSTRACARYSRLRTSVCPIFCKSRRSRARRRSSQRQPPLAETGHQLHDADV